MRKFKYGTLSVILGAVVIAAVIVVNVVFSTLAYSKNWYIDLTKEKIYGLTDAGRALLDTIDPEAQISVHFCSPFDTLEANGAQKMVFELVKQIAAEYDNVTYDYLDTVKNPSATIKYKTSTTSTITPDSIIVESDSEFRVFKLQAMFMIDTQSGSAWAFNGEKKLVSAMVACTLAEKPIAYYTMTHGESLSQSMLELFAEAGYEVKGIDLTKEEIAEDARLIIVSYPQHDFEGISELTAGRKSEIEKISDFLASWGNLMVFMAPGTEKLPEFEALLAEWGIEFEDAVLKDPSNSIDTNNYAIVGQYSTEQTLGGSLVSSIVSSGTPPKTVLYYTRPIKLLYASKDNRQASTAVYSSKNAQKYVDDELVASGQYSLVTVSREARYIDNIQYQSNVFAVGTPLFAADEFLKSTYGNSDILYTMMRAMGKKQVPIDLDFKVFEDHALDITTKEAWTWSGVITFALPVIAVAAGVVIWLRRKHA